GAAERIDRLLHDLGNAVLALRPEPGFRDADADAADIARVRAREESEAVAQIGVERGKAESRVRHAAREDARRIEGEAQRHDAVGRPATERQLDPGIAG